MNILINFAMSLNGSLGLRNSKTTISNLYDWKIVHQLRSSHDAIMVGANTIRIDNPSLLIKSDYYPNASTQPLRAIPTRSCSFPKDYKVFTDEYPTLLLTSSCNHSKINRKSWKNVEVMSLPNLEPITILHALEDYGLTSLMIEGGPSLIKSFLDSSISLKLRVFIRSFVLPVNSSVFWGGSSREVLLESLNRLGDGIEAWFNVP